MLTIAIVKTQVLGLEVYIVTINSVELNRFLSKELAVSKFMQLKRKYAMGGVHGKAI